MTTSPDIQDTCVTEVAFCRETAENNSRVAKLRNLTRPAVIIAPATVAIALLTAFAVCYVLRLDRNESLPAAS